MKTLKIATFSFLLSVAGFSQAQEEAPKFRAVPSGRVLVDGALYASPQKELYKDGMAIPEARLGVKMSYDKWSSWIDVGFAYGKIGLRNMWVQYDFNPRNQLRIGNFIQPFGLQSTTTLALKCTYEQPLVSAIFTPGIQLGVMYTHLAPAFLSASSFHVESSALTNVMNYPMFNQQGYTILSRLIWRQPESGKPSRPILQAGISGGFSTPQRTLVDNEDIHNGFAFSANYPTRVANVEAVGAAVGNAMNLFKFTPELLLAYRNFALESQYFFQQVNRRDHLPRYVSQGAYVTLRAMITGGSYGYNAETGDVIYPKKNALECAIDYNYVNMSDVKSKIFGGRANGFNVTLNYYFNPYITARLNYTFTHTWERDGHIPSTLNGFQARIMVLF